MLSVHTSCPSVTQSLQPSQWCRGARVQQVLMLAMALRYNGNDICNWVWQREATKCFKEKIIVLDLVRKQIICWGCQARQSGWMHCCDPAKKEEESHLFCYWKNNGQSFAQSMYSLSWTGKAFSWHVCLLRNTVYRSWHCLWFQASLDVSEHILGASVTWNTAIENKLCSQVHALWNSRG